jgi:hypothetical protein
MLRLKAAFPSLVVCAAVFGFCGSADASLVNNGSFETGDFTGWIQTGNTGFAGVTCPGGAPGGNCFGFFGPVGSDGGISQSLATTPGASYIVDFFFQPDGGKPSDFSAIFGGTTLISLTNPPGSAFTEYTFVVTATGASTDLAFNFRDDPGFLFLDEVSVNETPLPAALPLFAGGLGVIGLLARRRKGKAATVAA